MEKDLKANFLVLSPRPFATLVPRVRIELTWRVLQTRALTNFATSARRNGYHFDEFWLNAKTRLHFIIPPFPFEILANFAGTPFWGIILRQTLRFFLKSFPWVILADYLCGLQQSDFFRKNILRYCDLARL